MRKRKHEMIENIPEWDAASYHTGSARPPKQSNRLVMILLVCAIFLGGLASGLGIVNVRLISMMVQQNSVTPMDTAGATVITDPNAFLQTNDDPAPNVPAERSGLMILDSTPEAALPDDIYDRNERSLVSVYCTTHCNETLSGTGIVISSDGYVLTNAHVIEAAKRIFVYLPDGRLLRAAAVGSDQFSDLAVLYIEAENLTPAIFTTAHDLQTDDAVYAPQNQPDADNNRLLSGAVHDLKELTTGELTVRVLQSSLWGNSGPVFNDRGQIVAIRAGKITQYFEDDVCGQYGIAIPSETVQTVVTELIEQGCVAGRPAMGIRVEAISKLYQHYWDLPGGLLVAELDENGSAASQGLQAGDILLALDGTQLTSRADLYAALYAANVGDALTATVFRNGTSFTLTLTVEEIEE